MLRTYLEITPVIADTVFVAESAEVIGKVRIEANSSIWFGAIIRGDTNCIRIGENVNIQDRCVLHVDKDKNPLWIGNGVTIGHGAIIHGCTIGDGALIGMGTIILGGAIIGEESIIGAGALVIENDIIPARSLVMGAPAEVRRQVTDAELLYAAQLARDYVELSLKYRAAQH